MKRVFSGYIGDVYHNKKRLAFAGYSASESAPAGFKGTVLGVYGMLQGIGLLLSSVIAGLLWDHINSGAPFWFGGVLGIISASFIAVLLGRRYTGRQEDH